MLCTELARDPSSASIALWKCKYRKLMGAAAASLALGGRRRTGACSAVPQTACAILCKPGHCLPPASVVGPWACTGQGWEVAVCRFCARALPAAGSRGKPGQAPHALHSAEHEVSTPSCAWHVRWSDTKRSAQPRLPVPLSLASPLGQASLLLPHLSPTLHCPAPAVIPVPACMCAL